MDLPGSISSDSSEEALHDHGLDLTRTPSHRVSDLAAKRASSTNNGLSLSVLQQIDAWAAELPTPKAFGYDEGYAGNRKRRARSDSDEDDVGGLRPRRKKARRLPMNPFPVVSSRRRRPTVMFSRPVPRTAGFRGIWSGPVTGDFLAELRQRLEQIPFYTVPGNIEKWGRPKLNKAGRAAQSWYAGRRQPPLEAQLDAILNFFTYEASNSCKNWGTKAEKVVTYLEWLAFDDDRIQLHIASPLTRALFNEVLKKAIDQVLSEEVQNIKPTAVAGPRPQNSTTRLRSTRLDWMINRNDQSHLPAVVQALSRPALTGQQQVLLPKPVQPRPPTQVHTMLVEKPENARFHYTLMEDEKYWWRSLSTTDPDKAPPPPGAEDPTEVGNLAKIEDETFNAFFGALSSTWTATSPKLGWAAFLQSVKPAQNIAQQWAQERGVRRAAFQLSLRAVSAFPPPPTSSLQSSTSLKLPTRHRIIFPVPAATLRKAREAADVPAWILPCAPECQASAGAGAEAGAEGGEGDPRKSFETMRSVVVCRDLLRISAEIRKLGRAYAEHANINRPGVSTPELPHNLVNGAPIVWRGLTRQMQNGERLRKQCQTVVKMLQAAHDRAPRPLLQDVLNLVQRGIDGAFRDKSVPSGVRFAIDEWIGTGLGDRSPKMLDASDFGWLRFLAGEGANDKNRTGRFFPDEPKDRYRLFLLFASKVQKLLEDKNPQGLFARHNAQVKVEDLLAVINAGKDSSSTVTKYQFSPFEACAWLDRMKFTGHVKFRLDLSCYGVVERPHVQYFPEHRVTWKPSGAKYNRPRFSPKYISEWSDLKGPVPDVTKGSPIYSLFVALAYRLGYTIAVADKTAKGLPDSQLSRSSSRSATISPPPIMPIETLQTAITGWSQTCSEFLQTHYLDSQPQPTTDTNINIRAQSNNTTTIPESLTTLEPVLSQITRLRAGIIHDLHTNKTMLGPGRKVTYVDRHGQYRTTFTRDHSWDWASPKILGGTGAVIIKGVPSTGRRRFWSLDRWPGPAESIKAQVAEGGSGEGGLRLTEDEMRKGDPIAPRYCQPKLRPYAEEKVVFRPGPAAYWGGDTKLQREVLYGDTMAILGNAVDAYQEGGEEGGQLTWLKTLSMLNPFSEKQESNKLPTVDPDLVPQSWDPIETAEEQSRAEEEEYYGDEDEDVVEEEEKDIEVPTEDVLMTGMNPLLMV